jgi:ubiquinone/menaquinone biosynthesis C-methylase UbiE
VTQLSIVSEERKRAFESALAARYASEFDQLRVWPGHRQWWMDDMGCQHEARILVSLESLDCFVGFRGKTCVDLGCGSGASLIALQALGANAIGVDKELAGADLALARLRASVYGLEVRVLEGDVTDLPFSDASVDFALSTSVIEHVEDAAGHLRETHRVLRPGGRMVLATDNRMSIREPHTHLLMAHWLPRPAFVAFARRRLRVSPSTEIQVFPRSLRRYRRLARQSGFRVVAGRWDVFLARHGHETKSAKWIIAKFCRATGIPLELILPGTLLVLEKPC